MSAKHSPTLPVVIIGAGPAGLSAAAQLRARNLPFVVLEMGSAAGSAVAEWSHIRLFSAWSELVDPAAARLLTSTGWQPPTPKRYPTGAQWVASYLRPLADAMADSIRYRTKVTGLARRGRDLTVDAGREREPLTVHLTTPGGMERIDARAVIDASGTWSDPNPLGGDGLPAAGEVAARDQISYRVPNLADPEVRARYAGKHTAVAGTGASAKTALIELAALAAAEPNTRVTWLVRRSSTTTAFGGGENDQLAERGALGLRARAAVATDEVHTLTGFRTMSVHPSGAGRLRLQSFDGQGLDGVDEVVALTGFRPDLSFLSEVRLDLDPALQAPRALAPLIDPNVHSCGTVYPHGAEELAQPEPDFYLAGMKSYGRAPSFLALTGFEQVRSLVAHIAGDRDAAARVELTLPESGVCGGSGAFDELEPAEGGCSTAPAESLASVTVEKVASG